MVVVAIKWTGFSNPDHLVRIPLPSSCLSSVIARGSRQPSPRCTQAALDSQCPSSAAPEEDRLPLLVSPQKDTGCLCSMLTLGSMTVAKRME